MAVNYDPNRSNHSEDEDVINERATTKAKRRQALLACIDGPWRNEDIGLIERVETANLWGWTMQPYRP